MLKNRWWVPLITGFMFVFCLPPFNGQLHPALTLFPFASFVALIPLFIFARNPLGKRAMFHSYLFGLAASMGQVYWIGFVAPEGLWHLIILGLFLAAFYLALYYLAGAMLYRLFSRINPVVGILAGTAGWVLLEYIRELGDISFPWMHMGYAVVPILPLAQIASVCGVYGVSFIVVLVNLLILNFLRTSVRNQNTQRSFEAVAVAFLLLIVVGIWGMARLHTPAKPDQQQIKISCIQANEDQLHWTNNSLDTAFSDIGAMVQTASYSKPDLIVLSESALLCFLVRQPTFKAIVERWSTTTKIPLIVGALDCQPATNSNYRYFVYNTAFYVDTARQEFFPYNKIKLVPFSEAMPFEGILPILSRVNLGEADFMRGIEHTVFSIGPTIKAAPLVCYEIIYPQFVRERVIRGANILINITNDGWFGKTSGAYQHAVISQMRCIENGISLARCANSGFTMFVDPYGRVISRTKLYTRAILTATVPVGTLNTFYSRVGDWVVWVSLVLVITGVCGVVGLRMKKK